MSLLSVLGVGVVYAAPVTAQAPHSGGFWSMLWLPLLLILVFYFLLIRPQSKRAKEHRQLLEGISLGDEVVTTGGVVARVSRLKDNFVVLEISKGTEITVQKASIASVLPKGTIDSI
ncbi:preprotein translocase subunit YajC [Coxiella burnetii]|uniref:preprotein translocase subunit YajC n=1 Tax=Coxiella burnetii TaxID=777 RepID=UPI000183CF34|nr:preprotein translocase subunit YajC [Coxiella burnetii]ACJ18247.1 protein translocase subunit [Coxiella burnetii CbuG_Q212]ATN66630.1 preprotein translocase subunit YajC [Coxiella burnetii]OYK86389.1 preprotein translocase subunit YajC [Coxiella burnetii]